MHFVLRGHDVVETDDFMDAALLLNDTAARTVAKTTITAPDGTVTSEVSTVFLTINHSHTLDGPPILFETLVFGGPLANEQERYATWDEAEVGHAWMVERVRVAFQAEPTPVPVPQPKAEPAATQGRTWHDHLLDDD